MRLGLHLICPSPASGMFHLQLGMLLIDSTQLGHEMGMDGHGLVPRLPFVDRKRAWYILSVHTDKIVQDTLASTWIGT